ncbi:MAG: SAM-dependent methyltransferase [Ruminococcaceae bacterium]|nr:SAM-dependent methyltransferase [Oscillospiraceae bacterium]
MNAYLKFATLCRQAAEREMLKKAVFTAPVDSTVVRATGTLRRVGGEVKMQIESFYQDGKARHENLPCNETGEARLAEIAAGFARINLLTTVGDAELRQSKKGEWLLLGADKLARRLQSGGATVEVGGNDKAKKRILSGDEPFLKLLGVSDENGRVHDKKGPKFRQINRFLELIRDTLPHLPKDKIRICDLCCGKSYLSFAVYHYFANVLGYTVSMTGVDLKPDVVSTCNEVAEKLGFKGLHFLCGDVAAYESPERPQLVISLHACDTATDLVLEKGMAWEARVILSTPCCHHELNHTLCCPTLSFIAEHAMLRQKLCDAATDALRLKLLEANGYHVAALELIDPDDTPKNVMLRAIRREGEDEAARARAMAEYRAARAFLLGGES